MTLPKKKSRIIEVDGKKYRWLISKHWGTVELSIEATEHSGQLMQVSFESHNSYKRDLENRWQQINQGVSITPKIVRQVILHGLGNGWEPDKTGKLLFYIYIWEADKFLPELPELSPEELRLRDIAWEQVNDLRYDFSLDPERRKQLFNAPISQRFPLPSDYFALGKEAQSCGLKFAVFNDGWAGSSFIVFGIASADFPDIVAYTYNNPEII